jgi:hypothetical protein
MIRPPSAAVVDANGKVRALVVSAEPHVHVTEEQVKDTPTLARMMASVIREIMAIGRRPCPRRIDHEDVSVNGDGVTQYLLPHGFGGRVRWWVTDCTTSNGGMIRDASASTDDVLVLLSTTAGVVTVRVEEVDG